MLSLTVTQGPGHLLAPLLQARQGEAECPSARRLPVYPLHSTAPCSEPASHHSHDLGFHWGGTGDQIGAGALGTHSQKLPPLCSALFGLFPTHPDLNLGLVLISKMFTFHFIWKTEREGKTGSWFTPDIPTTAGDGPG